MKKNALTWLFLALMSLTATAKAPNSPWKPAGDKIKTKWDLGSQPCVARISPPYHGTLQLG